MTTFHFDMHRIGQTIARLRREHNMTQMQLAEKLNITDRAVSKWENGKSMPDSSIMLELCKELNITVNDLLCGEVVEMDNYNKKAEETLIELVKQKEKTDKYLLSLEILIGTFSVIILLGFTFVAAFAEMADWLRVCLITAGFVVGVIGIMYALRIEQTAGYYECGHCHHRYVPTFTSVLVAMHFGRTRFMQCPECKKWSWQKKELTKGKE